LNKSATAVIREGQKYKAVVLNRKGGIYELWQKQESVIQGISLASFCRELSSLTQSRFGQSVRIPLAIGFSQAQTAFYRLEVPWAKESQVESMVEMQAEAILPLPRDQMRLAWRNGVMTEGKTIVTLAAARTEHVRLFSEHVELCKPQAIMLESEAVIKAWQTLYAGTNEKAIIVYIGKTNTQICLAEESKLAMARISDVRRQDLVRQDDLSVVYAEQLAQDIYGMLESFGVNPTECCPIYVLSDQSESINKITEYLKQTELKGQISVIERSCLKNKEATTEADIYEYLVPVGLALMTMDGENSEYNLFAWEPMGGKGVRRKIHVPSMKVSGLIALAMLAVFLLVFYRLDVVRENRLTEQLVQAGSIESRQLIKKNELKKAVSRIRPDIPGLLALIHECDPQGMQLDMINVAKGRPVELAGNTQDKNKIFAFQEKLQKQKGVKTFRKEIREFDPKKKVFNFTVTFEYKQFSQKSKRKISDIYSSRNN